MKKEWNDRQVEELIRKAVDRSVPDLYEQVSAGAVPPLLNADDIVPPPVSRRRSRWPLACWPVQPWSCVWGPGAGLPRQPTPPLARSRPWSSQ